eukprot:tig00001130_g7232.t1
MTAPVDVTSSTAALAWPSGSSPVRATSPARDPAEEDWPGGRHTKHRLEHAREHVVEGAQLRCKFCQLQTAQKPPNLMKEFSDLLRNDAAERRALDLQLSGLSSAGFPPRGASAKGSRPNSGASSSKGGHMRYLQEALRGQPRSGGGVAEVLSMNRSASDGAMVARMTAGHPESLAMDRALLFSSNLEKAIDRKAAAAVHKGIESCLEGVLARAVDGRAKEIADSRVGPLVKRYVDATLEPSVEAALEGRLREGGALHQRLRHAAAENHQRLEGSLRGYLESGAFGRRVEEAVQRHLEERLAGALEGALATALPAAVGAFLGRGDGEFAALHARAVGAAVQSTFGSTGTRWRRSCGASCGRSSARGCGRKWRGRGGGGGGAGVERWRAESEALRGLVRGLEGELDLYTRALNRAWSVIAALSRKLRPGTPRAPRAPPAPPPPSATRRERLEAQEEYPASGAGADSARARQQLAALLARLEPDPPAG